ncbi:MAG TPA: hypothetical protein VHT03_06345 [Rhizomicrobium sp.]|jgi:hypothetical protein|nr:hypothetical protein [Rhizomicrobium sp.]
MTTITVSRARSDLACHQEGMQRLRARAQDIQLIAMKLAEAEHFAKQEQAVADDVANRNRERVRRWLKSELDGNPTAVPFDEILDDEDNAAALRDWDRIKKAAAPAIAELQERQRLTTQALIEGETGQPALVDAVLVEQVPELERQFAAAIQYVRTIGARIEALRTHLASRKNYKLLERVGRGHAFDLIPERADLNVAADHWSRYANALAANPHATVEP